MPQALQRFEQAPERPPDKVIRQLNGHIPADWRPTQVGYAGPFPNGGIWHYAPGLVMKRLGAQFLGKNKVWRGSLDPAHPHWWVREAEFYRSELATTGWGPQARPARCYDVADGPAETIELWLEALEIPSLSLDTFQKAVASLACWQIANAKHTAGWLTLNWIPSHLERRGLDNTATLAHKNWRHAIERGLSPRVREAASKRVTDPGEARRRLAGLPQVLTHYDFHKSNIGRSPDGSVRIIDWAYVGWGPIGLDAGHLALDGWDRIGSTLDEAWDDLIVTYTEALQAAGWSGTADEVRGSVETATAIRLGWGIDEVLDNATSMPDDAWAVAARNVEFVAGLIDRLS